MGCTHILPGLREAQVTDCNIAAMTALMRPLDSATGAVSLHGGMTKSRVHAVLAYSVLLACGAAQASDWVTLGKSSNGKTEDFVDLSSIRVSGQIRRVWAKIIYAPHAQRDTSGADRWVNYFVALYAYNCADETSRLEAATFYFSDGETSTVKNPTPEPWEPVTPDTVESFRMNYLCSWKPN